MAEAASAGWPAAKDGSIVISGKRLCIPSLRVLKEVGRGANAVVFEAIDESLDRRVALKVWNVRGVSRAQLETKKIAQLTHPLIVTTYQFGQVDDHPFSVMEFVPGSSGKVWLRDDPPVGSRIWVWKLYSRALRFIHDTGEIHGDPHLGNVLIIQDPSGIYGRESAWGEAALGIKLADAGTSEFWSSREGILSREATLIGETAERLFKDQDLDRLWLHSPSLSYRDTLLALDTFCEYVLQISEAPEDRQSGQFADRLVNLLVKTPLFDLDEMVLKVSESGHTTSDRVARRLNQRLLDLRDLFDASDIIGDDTKRRYAMMRKKYLNERVSAAST